MHLNVANVVYACPPMQWRCQWWWAQHRWWQAACWQHMAHAPALQPGGALADAAAKHAAHWVAICVVGNHSTVKGRLVVSHAIRGGEMGGAL